MGHEKCNDLELLGKKEIKEMKKNKGKFAEGNLATRCVHEGGSDWALG